MRMEFRRLIGALVFDRPWPVQGLSKKQLDDQAKDALASLYEGDGRSVWPKKEYASNAPEEVRIVDASGAVLAHYDIRNLVADTKCSSARSADECSFANWPSLTRRGGRHSFPDRAHCAI